MLNELIVRRRGDVYQCITLDSGAICSLQEIMRSIDADGSGVIDYTEFLAARVHDVDSLSAALT